MYKLLLIVCAIILLASTEPSPVITEVVEEIDLENYRLNPGEPPFFQLVEFNTSELIKYVAVFTDWWKKRPTQIIVTNIAIYDDVANWYSTTYDSSICGDWDNLNVECSYPDNPTARILVELDQETSSKRFLVRISGLLDDNQEYAILKTLQFLR